MAEDVKLHRHRYQDLKSRIRHFRAHSSLFETMFTLPPKVGKYAFWNAYAQKKSLVKMAS